jgi:hypothetical protein
VGVLKERKKWESAEERKVHLTTGERDLLSSVLLRAVLDYIRSSPLAIDPKWQRDAKQWFDSEERTPFSFIWVCEHLDLEPAEILKLIESFVKDDIKIKPRGSRHRRGVFVLVEKTLQFDIYTRI